MYLLASGYSFMVVEDLTLVDVKFNPYSYLLELRDSISNIRIDEFPTTMDKI